MKQGRLSAAGLEARMGSKEKGGRSTKKVAAKDLKQKRADKQAKKDSVAGKPTKVV